MSKGLHIYIRVTEEEKNIIQEKAAKQNMSVSDYVRQQSIKGKIVDYSNLTKLISQVNYIGNNLNQAVKILNMYRMADDRDYNYIYDEFMKLKKLIEKELK